MQLGIDWTVVLVALIGAVPASIAAVGVWMNRRDLRTQSGDPIGHVVERTHDLTAVNTKTLHRLNGGEHEDEPDA